MYNLISNASKFSNNSTIKVDVSTVLINNQGIFSVKVIDQGIGMTKDQLSMLFNNYVQAHAKIVDQYGGTGLGLALSKKLANMTGGNLVATSEIDVGSVFELTLPLQQEKNVVAF
jgi:signal transduction histidine kinase